MQRQGRRNSIQLAKALLLSAFFGLAFEPVLLAAQGTQGSGESPQSNQGQEKPRSSQLSYETYVMCRSSSQARTLRIVQTSKGCITRYQKDGQEKVVATAQSLGVCHDVLGKIQKNLMENNWNCQDLSQSSISSSD